LRQFFVKGRNRGIGISALILAASLVGAPAALANSTKSTNWAGYAVHRTGVSFREVSGTWTQPSATCIKGQPAYSAVWVGLGGYNPAADALEQIGTEVDCTATGRVRSSAWYELVPAPSHTISLAVAPGDEMKATVTVTGLRVVVLLENLTQHSHFRKAFNASSIDVSSAEWIVEAPSVCAGQFSCQALPLADFGAVTFDSTTAAAILGAPGSIVDSRWDRTKIRLTPGNQRFIVARNSSAITGTAAPSALRSGGTAFDVTYATATTQPGRSFARDARVRSGYVQH
jgi:hypothetical protein